MSTREQFGPYLLLKKLTEDGLGETFRAGKVVQGAIDRVALLRVFNGRGLDTRGLLDRIASRRKLGEHLSGPNIMTAVDIGEAQGTPYVAYDYVAGKDLASLLDQATAKRSPFPTDHALLVAERVSQALAMAGEVKIDGNRVLHGFVVPQFVRISNEGETRLMGFESGPALRGLLSSPTLAKPFARYLAPEALGGTAPDRSDDVYSLGVLLYELLAGQMLPPPSASGYADVVDRASLAADGSPLPSEIAGLLKRSLAAKEQRIPDALTWHKALSKMMYEGQYNPTTFNLAFFMHNLFRSEIERETQELQVEKTLKIPAQTAAAAPAAKATTPAAPAAPAEGSGVRQDTLAVRERYGIEGEETKKKNTGLIAAVAAIIVLGGLAAGYFFWYRKGPGAKGPAEQTAAATTSQMATTSPVASGTSDLTGQTSPNAGEQTGTKAAGGAMAGRGSEAATQPSAEEAAAKESQADLQNQISKIVEERMKATEKGISAKYDQQIQALQKQLADAKKAAARQAEEAAKAKANTAPAKQQEAPASQEATKAAGGSATQPHPGAENAAMSKSPAAAGQQASAPASQPTSGGGAPTAAGSSTSAQMTQPPAQPKPQAPQIHRGDLVSPGTPGFVAPRKVFEKPPVYPPVAKRFGKRATVVLSVLVDDTGRVQKTRLISKPASFGFDQAAMEAARQTRWEPATVHGIPVKTWVEIRVVFEPPQN
ncbi:MAG TPA: TonB family protein, partial [Thermoanaerobaculia bacterium]|nr:TonB family protein [Thermoanaerobaculia bacterium]